MTITMFAYTAYRYHENFCCGIDYVFERRNCPSVDDASDLILEV